MSDLPLHLLFPLLASLLFVSGLIFIKRTSEAGVNPWTVTFIANQWAAILFTFVWFSGGQVPSLTLLWQPALIAILYILGQIFTFSAIRYGDVSVATPVFGIKVVLVAFLLAVGFSVKLPPGIWAGASMATVGIALVQWNPSASSTVREKKSMVLALVFAVLAASSFATFDVVVQQFSPRWGAGRLLPISYWMVAFLSLGFLPWFQPQYLKSSSTRLPLLVGTLLIGMQAICIVYTVATYGDAARVNVVYAMRGMWGVLLAYLAAKRWGGVEAHLPRRVLVARFMGAGLLTAAVVLIIVSGTE